MEFIIRKAEEKEAESIARFIKNVWLDMPQKSWFAVEDTGYIRQVLADKNNLVLQAIEKEKTQRAGVFVAVVPALHADNLGRDLGFSDHQLLQVAHMDIVAVSADFRGKDLQNLLFNEAEKILQAQGFGYLLCTVHPENSYSCRNIEKRGYSLMRQVLKYGGLPRNIYLKDI